MYVYVYYVLALGQPVYADEDDCTYMFDWDTSLACITPQVDKTCQVERDGHTYDLSDLVITKTMERGKQGGHFTDIKMYLSLSQTSICRISLYFILWVYIRFFKDILERNGENKLALFSKSCLACLRISCCRNLS